MSVGKRSKLVLDFIKMLDQTPGFANQLTRVNILTCDKGKCTAEFTVEKDMCNEYDTLHGAYSSLLLDNITTYALMSYYSPEKLTNSIKGVTVSMYNQYFKAAKLGSQVFLDASSVRVGKKLAFLELKMIEKDTGILLAKGSHTKFIDM